MTSKMAYLLGELRREMNGAVVGSMRYYGAEYGLNYGVSIPTIRAMGRSETAEGKEHRLGRYLFLQEVRELRLVSLWFADPSLIEENQELDFWAKGIINTEVAEEAAFALLKGVESIDRWLNEESELLQYCAVLAIAGAIAEGGNHAPLNEIRPRLIELLGANPSILPKAIIPLLEQYLRRAESKQVVEFLGQMPSNSACNNIREEMSWRM
ncbi:MAG: DNA alkylation repair protein [Rikenellaceae bacterium]